jgi:hypothetical protein
MMTAVQLARAHLVVSLCVGNICLAFALCKLAVEMRDHEKLQKSHSALQKQAAGISKEYTRVTNAPADAQVKDPSTAHKLELEELTKKCSELQVLSWTFLSKAVTWLVTKSSNCLKVLVKHTKNLSD